MKQELRTLSVAVRTAAKDDAFELNGTAVSYNVLSQDLGGFRERIAPGCFTRALASPTLDVKFLVNHDASKILGRSKNGTLQIFDTPQGLNFRCILDPNQQAHHDIHSSIKRGDISQCSFAFRPTDLDGETLDESFDERGARFWLRTIKQANLFDLSAVTTPAYNAPGATTVVARSVAAPVVTRRHEKSLEQRFFESTGRWPVNPETLAIRMATLSLQVEADRRALAAENEQAARNAAIVTAELFPWEIRN